MAENEQIRKLTPKQALFVSEYCSNGYNGYQAAKAAGYKGSYFVLANVATENLKKPYLKAVIDDNIRQRQVKCEFNREQSEQELINAQQRAIAKGDIGAEIAAIREKNTIFALRTENINTTITDQQAELDESEQEAARQIAIIANRESIKVRKGA